MNLEQITNLYTIFQSLSSEIKDWFLEEKTNKDIQGVVRQFVLSDDQALKIPFLLLRLVTQNLPPEQFKAALAEALTIDHALAEKITNALAEKILAPIKDPLKTAGVDIELLKFDTPVNEQIANRKSQIPQPSVQHLEPGIQSKPFVLHAEPSFSRNEEHTAPDTKPSFIFNPAETIDAPRASAPAKVIIERVVHYNQLRTPLNQTSIPKPNVKKEVGVPKTKWFI